MVLPTFSVNLNAVDIDFPLARRVPYALSRYYLALALGQENGSVSLAMAYPENLKARQVLGRLLQADVVPVYTPAEQLLPILEHVYCPQHGAKRSILAWHDGAEWETAVSHSATLLSQTLLAPVTACTAAEVSLAQVLALTVTSQHELLVLPAPDLKQLPTVLNRTAKPLFFVRGAPTNIQRILVVMRGFASDERALDWLTPFAWQNGTAVTLLPLTNGSDLGPYLHPDSLSGQHLDRCLRRLHAEGVTLQLKFRQGSLVQQVVDELASSATPYDLLAIAAEGAGDFVYQVITAVDDHKTHVGRPIFVLKPPTADITAPNPPIAQGEQDNGKSPL